MTPCSSLHQPGQASQSRRRRLCDFFFLSFPPPFPSIPRCSFLLSSPSVISLLLLSVSQISDSISTPRKHARTRTNTHAHTPVVWWQKSSLGGPILRPLAVIHQPPICVPSASHLPHQTAFPTLVSIAFPSSANLTVFLSTFASRTRWRPLDPNIPLTFCFSTTLRLSFARLFFSFLFFFIFFSSLLATANSLLDSETASCSPPFESLPSLWLGPDFWPVCDDDQAIPGHLFSSHLPPSRSDFITKPSTPHLDSAERSSRAARLSRRPSPLVVSVRLRKTKTSHFTHPPAPF